MWITKRVKHKLKYVNISREYIILLYWYPGHFYFFTIKCFHSSWRNAEDTRVRTMNNFSNFSFVWQTKTRTDFETTTTPNYKCWKIIIASMTFSRKRCEYVSATGNSSFKYFPLLVLVCWVPYVPFYDWNYINYCTALSLVYLRSAL